jgi:hypothetical protein
MNHDFSKSSLGFEWSKRVIGAVDNLEVEVRPATHLSRVRSQVPFDHVEPAIVEAEK